MATGKSSTSLMKRLAGLSRRRRLFALHRGGCVVLLVAVALLVLLFLLDWRLHLEGGARLALLVAGLLVTVATAYLVWWRHRRPHDPLISALEVERAHPELAGLLVSYVQFSEDGEAQNGASPSLVAAMRKQADEQCAAISFRPLVRFSALWKLYLAAALTCLVVAAAAISQPGFARAFLARISDPFSDHSYPTRTIIKEIHGGPLAQHGKPLLLRAVVSGILPEEIAIRFQPQDGPEEIIQVRKGTSNEDGNRVFDHEIQDVQQDFHFRILAGDAASPTVHVRVVRAPGERIVARVTYPPYIERPPATEPLPTFEAPAGSKIQWTLTLDRPVSDGRLLLDDGRSLPVVFTNGNRSATVEASPGESFTYGLEWTDEESGFVFEPTVRYPVSMLPDLPPEVTLAPGTADQKASVRTAVDVDFTATDDHGLASARIAYSVTRSGRDATEKTTEIRQFHRTTKSASTKFKWRPIASIPDLAPGDVIRYTVEALDRRPAPGGPGVGRSETRTITVVTREEYLTLANEKRRLLLARIKNLRDEEIQADTQIQALLKELDEEIPESP